MKRTSNQMEKDVGGSVRDVPTDTKKQPSRRSRRVAASAQRDNDSVEEGKTETAPGADIQKQESVPSKVATSAQRDNESMEEGKTETAPGADIQKQGSVPSKGATSGLQEKGKIGKERDVQPRRSKRKHISLSHREILTKSKPKKSKPPSSEDSSSDGSSSTGSEDSSSDDSSSDDSSSDDSKEDNTDKDTSANQGVNIKESKQHQHSKKNNDEINKMPGKKVKDKNEDSAKDPVPDARVVVADIQPSSEDPFVPLNPKTYIKPGFKRVLTMLTERYEFDENIQDNNPQFLRRELKLTEWHYFYSYLFEFPSYWIYNEQKTEIQAAVVFELKHKLLMKKKRNKKRRSYASVITIHYTTAPNKYLALLIAYICDKHSQHHQKYIYVSIHSHKNQLSAMRLKEENPGQRNNAVEMIRFWSSLNVVDLPTYMQEPGDPHNVHNMGNQPGKRASTHEMEMIRGGKRPDLLRRLRKYEKDTPPEVQRKIDRAETDTWLSMSSINSSIVTNYENLKLLLIRQASPTNAVFSDSHTMFGAEREAVAVSLNEKLPDMLNILYSYAVTETSDSNLSISDIFDSGIKDVIVPAWSYPASKYVVYGYWPTQQDEGKRPAIIKYNKFLGAFPIPFDEVHGADGVKKAVKEAMKKVCDGNDRTITIHPTLMGFKQHDSGNNLSTQKGITCNDESVLSQCCAWLSIMSMMQFVDPYGYSILLKRFNENPHKYQHMVVYSEEKARAFGCEKSLVQELQDKQLKYRLEKVKVNKKDPNFWNNWLKNKSIEGHFLCSLCTKSGQSTHGIGLTRNGDGSGKIFDSMYQELNFDCDFGLANFNVIFEDENDVIESFKFAAELLLPKKRSTEMYV